MPQASDNEIPYNRPRRRRSSVGTTLNQERERPTRQDELIGRIREILSEPLESGSPARAGTTTRSTGIPRRRRFPSFPNVAHLSPFPNWAGAIVVGLVIVALIAVIGPFIQNRVEEAATRSIPVIHSINFPKQVPIDGRKHAGTV